MGAHAAAMAMAAALPWSHRPLPPGKPRTIALTGTFYNENWIMNHLRPLVLSEQVAHVWLVCTFPIPPTDKVTVVRPPALLARVIGETQARLLAFAWLCLRRRPDYIGGFHILLNGLVAIFLARLLGRRSLYFCGGGPREVIDGGFQSDNRLFKLLKRPDPWIERRLLAAIQRCDVVVTMGRRTVSYFRGKGLTTRFEVIPGGISTAQFKPRAIRKDFDLILLGRLVQVKRIDIFLHAVARLREQVPTISAAVVGAGELESRLKALAAELRITGNVTFAGYQRNSMEWLHRSRIFVMTSDSEGLSLALMEALACGLPAVVSDVGELGELVQHGQNGYLVQERTPAAFASGIHDFLTSPDLYKRVSAAAVESANEVEITSAAAKWSSVME